ncbi:hydroxyacid dehydrogenase [Rhodococcus koreensis]
MTRPVVVVSEPIHERGIELLERECDVRKVYYGDASDAEVAAALAEADAMILRRVPLPGDLLRQCPKLKVIAKHGAGLDSVDLSTATELGIVVSTCGPTNSISVAEHALTLMLAVRRRVPELDILTRQGRYHDRASLRNFPDMHGSTVGIVGFGNIGRAAAKMLGKGLGCTILAYDPVVDADTMRGAGAEKVELGELFRRADAITLHLPLTEKTRNLVDAEHLALMKPSAILVNTSRGGTVDETALISALEQGRLAGVGLDVFEPEPPSVDNPLFSLPNCVFSPHVGGYAESSMIGMAVEAAQSALAVLNGVAPQHVFNTDVLGHNRAGISVQRGAS